MNTKMPLIFCIAILFSISTHAQVTDAEKTLKTQSKDTVDGWKTGGIISANLAQTRISNWASGGENSLAIQGLFQLYANYKKDKNAWDNSLDIGYGVLGTGDKSLYYKKTDDKIDFLTKYGRQAHKNFYYAALGNVRTQMAAGYNYPNDSIAISKFLAPAYITTALGIDYKPNTYVSMFLAPITGRITIVNDQILADAGAFGVSPGENIRTEFGGYIRLIYSRKDFENEILKNVAFTSKLDLFSNYLEKPQNIDINWETQISWKINKFMSVNFNTHLIYDDDIKFGVDTNNDGVDDKFVPKLQFKQIFGLGIAVRF